MGREALGHEPVCGRAGQVPDGVHYLELPPALRILPGSLERVLLDAQGRAAWWPITPADLTRRLAGGTW